MKTHQTYQTACKKSTEGNALLRKSVIAISLVLLGSLVTEAGQGPQPSICTRSCWGARASMGCGTMSTLNRAMVHHTAGTADYTTDYETGKARVRGVQNMHIDINGWCDIGYHFLINAGGHIYEGRHNSMAGLPIGTHDGCYVNSFGFSVLGYYHPPYNQTFTAASRNSLEAVIAWRMPSAWSPYGYGTYCGATVGVLDGHNMVGATACPGSIIIPLIASIRDGVDGRKNGIAPYAGPVSSNGDGRLAVFGVAGNSEVYRIEQTVVNGGYGDSSSLGGVLTPSVVVGKNKDGRLQIFSVAAANGGIYTAWQTTPNGSWSSWLSIGGGVFTTNSLRVGYMADGRLAVFGIAPANNGLYWTSQTGVNSSSSWTTSAAVGATLTAGSLAVGNYADGRIAVFGIAPANGGLYMSLESAVNGTTWNTSSQLSGIYKPGSLAVGNMANGTMAVFGVAPANTNLYWTYQSGPNGTWGTSKKLSGILNSHLAVGKMADGRLAVFATAPANNQLYWTYETSVNGTSWSTSTAIPATLRPNVAVGRNQDGRLSVFGVALSNNLLYIQSQTSANSGSWTTSAQLQALFPFDL